jgi:uncharacterized OB-fold protein
MIELLLPEQPAPETSAPFWAAAARGELVIQRCDECGALQHPPGPVCLSCLSDSLSFVPVSGKGTIYSFTVVHRALIPELRPHVPYVLALIDLVEGVRLVSLIRGDGARDVRIGQDVVVGFLPVGPVTLPVFEPR